VAGENVGFCPLNLIPAAEEQISNFIYVLARKVGINEVNRLRETIQNRDDLVAMLLVASCFGFRL